MTNIVNFERDMWWCSNGAALTPILSDYNSSPTLVTDDGSVGQRVSRFHGVLSITAGTGAQCVSVGAAILPPPDGDSVPYRFKGACSASSRVLWSVGYKTGTSTVERQRIVASGSVCDEVVLIDPLDGADPNYGDALVFFCTAMRDSASYAVFGGSVQRLIAKPPQFAVAVS